MQMPGVHIESLHNRRRYTHAQIDRACAIAQRLGCGKLVLVEDRLRVELRALMASRLSATGARSG